MDALGLVYQVLLLGLFVDLLFLSAPTLGSWIAASGPSRSLHRHTGSSLWAEMKSRPWSGGRALASIEHRPRTIDATAGRARRAARAPASPDAREPSRGDRSVLAVDEAVPAWCPHLHLRSVRGITRRSLPMNATLEGVLIGGLRLSLALIAVEDVLVSVDQPPCVSHSALVDGVRGHDPESTQKALDRISRGPATVRRRPRSPRRRPASTTPARSHR